MGNPILINKNTEENINYNLRGRIPANHVDLGKGLCPFDKRHTVHLVHTKSYTDYQPIKYVCINCGFMREAQSKM